MSEASGIMNDVRIYDEVIKCTQCNLCILGCPMFMGSRYDHFSPRAIIVGIRDYIKRGGSVDGSLIEVLFMCNLCKNCEVRCPSKIEITKIVMVMKKKIMGLFP